MTKEEREALAAKSASLDLLQNLLHKGMFPGVAAGDVVRSQQFILGEWNKIQADIEAETKRIEKLINATTPMLYQAESGVKLDEHAA